MNKILVKSILVNSNCLICITDTGNTVMLTEPKTVNWVLEQALPVFTKNPEATLVLVLDNLDETQIITKDGSVIKFNSTSITTNDKKYFIDMRNLGKFSAYAKEHGYSINKFIEKVSESLEFNHTESTKDLFTFLEKNNLPITVDGDVLAYKILDKYDDDTFVDCYTKSVLQRVGDEVYIPRNLVTINREVHCASGLHVCSIGYFSQFYSGSSSGQAIALVKVDPRDICSVPNDTKSKVRCCRYQILGLIEPEELDAIYANNLEEAPKYKKLLSDAVNGLFIGINSQVELLVQTTKSSKDICIHTVGTFSLKGNTNTEEQFNKLVEKKENTKRQFSLYNFSRLTKQVRYILHNSYKLFESEERIAEQQEYRKSVMRGYLSKLKEALNFYSWEELGIDDAWKDDCLWFADELKINLDD